MSQALRCPFCHDPSVTSYPTRGRRQGTAICRACDRPFSDRDEARDLFHWLWGDAVEVNRDYKDEKWQDHREMRARWNRLKDLMGW